MRQLLAKFKPSMPQPGAAQAIEQRQPSRWLHLGQGLMVVWALLGGSAIALNFPWVQHLEGQAQAFLLLLRGPVNPPESILILAIDEESLAQGDIYRNHPEQYPFLAPIQAWPWQRAAYAEVIEKVLAAGAKSISVDVVLADPSSYGSADDQRLRDVLQKHGDQVNLAALYEVTNATGGESVQLITPIYTDLSYGRGIINFPVDQDTRLRQMPQPFLADLRSYTGLPSAFPAFSEAALQQAGLSYPPLKGSQIFFYGPEQTFSYVPFWQVLDPKTWEYHERMGTFRDKVVLIGPTAGSLQDLKLTPTSNTMPGVEVHANAAATLLEGRALMPIFPSPVSRGILVAVVMVGVGSLLGYGITRPLLRLAGFIGVAIAWVGVSYLCLIYGQTLVPLAIPVAILGWGGLSHTAISALGEQLEQRRLRRTLERYVAPSVVQEILTQPDDFHGLMVGRKLNAAVLFSDIRGFSQLSFQLPAEILVAQLNQYLEAMVQAILTHRGTIDKFIGDAVMAEFGSPKSQGAEVDAMNAIRAALAMRTALAALRQHQHQHQQPLLFHGIGISYGEIVAGNIGSIQRLEFTVIGDTVNVASRVEGLTKKLGADILITAPLYALVADAVDVVDMGWHRLSGREQEAVQVYSLIGLKGDDPSLYHQVQADFQAYVAALSQAKPTVGD